jgi:hypothetical protein
MYHEDVAALFGSVPVGSTAWLINEPVKIAYVDGKLLMEVHPPVDGEGQTTEIDMEVMSLERAEIDDFFLSGKSLTPPKSRGLFQSRRFAQRPVRDSCWTAVQKPSSTLRSAN